MFSRNSNMLKYITSVEETKSNGLAADTRTVELEVIPTLEYLTITVYGFILVHC
jgi:hypothetical protein